MEHEDIIAVVFKKNGIDMGCEILYRSGSKLSLTVEKVTSFKDLLEVTVNKKIAPTPCQVEPVRTLNT